MERINAGYRIIESVRLDRRNEVVVGRAENPLRPSQYVCWDCTDGNSYNNGGYCSTYRGALSVMVERVNRRIDYVPLEYEGGVSNEERNS